jgi:hypothetical protein
MLGMLGRLGKLRRRGRAFAPRTMPPATAAIVAPPAISGALSFEAVLGSGVGSVFAAAGRRRALDVEREADAERPRLADLVLVGRDFGVVAIGVCYPATTGQLSGAMGLLGGLRGERRLPVEGDTAGAAIHADAVVPRESQQGLADQDVRR